MRAFLKRFLGLETIETQMKVLMQRYKQLEKKNESLELEISALRGKSVCLKGTQAQSLEVVLGRLQGTK